MINQFPIVLSTGAIARYPMARQRRFSTKQNDFADFSRQAAPLLANPLMNWDITLAQLTDAEFADVSQFFDQQQGSYGTFTFVDPWDNLLQYSEAFENAVWQNSGGMIVGQNYLLNSQDFEKSSWTLNNVGASNPVVTPDSQTAPDGTATADAIAFPSVPNTLGDNSWIQQVVTPPVTPIMTLTFSAWLRVASGTGSIQISVSDGISQSGTTTCSLTTTWQRLSATVAFNSSPGSSVTVQIVNPHNSSAVTVWTWGSQLEYGTTPSDYTLTTTAIAPLQIADYFFQQAPSGVPGNSWNLNSSFAKRGRQFVVTSSTAQSIVQNVPVAPGGNGSSRTKGITFTASVYFKQQGSTAPTSSWGLFSSNGIITPESSIKSFTPGSSWARASQSFTFSASDNGTFMQFQIGFGGMTVGQTFYVFGAQLEAEGTVSSYKQTQAVSGVHPNCYINTDEYAQIASEFDVNVFENSMRQRRSTLSQLSDVLTIFECNPT